MVEDKLIKFSIDQELTPEQIEEMQFSKVKMKIYSADRINTHGYFVTLKNLKKWAKTVAGKPIVMYYNEILDDVAGHERDEIACGFVPFNPEISYEKSEDGTVYLCVIGYIWNMYYDYLVNVFNNSDGVKGLSCEMLILESQYDEDLDAEEILQYSFAGLTLLGNVDKNFVPIKPAVDGCDATLIHNSGANEYFEKAKNEFEQYLYNSVKQESFNEDSFFNKQNLKENVMEEKDLVMNSETPTSIDATIVENAECVENVEVAENAVKEVTNRVSVETSTWEYDDDGCYVGNTHEAHTMTETHFEEVVESEEQLSNNSSEDVKTVENADEVEVVENAEVVENDCDKEKDSEIVENAITEEAYNELLQLNSALQIELDQLRADYNALMVKCSSLQEFKDNTEQKAMKNSIEVALNSVSHILNTEQIDEWRREADSCSVDTLSDYTNRLKAFAFDIQEKNGIKEIETYRNSIPVDVEEVESADVWDRLDKRYF